MLTHYIESLTAGIRRHELIRKNAQLKSKHWTKSCYELAADIVGSQLDKLLLPAEKLQMGTTISAKTLSNMFKGEYRLNYPIDPRTLNTLNKLSRFLGLDSWELFMDLSDEHRNEAAQSADPANAAALALREAIAAEFRAYVNLPGTEPNQLLQHYLPHSPAFNRIMDALLQLNEKGWQASNPYNPSTFEILEFELLSANPEQARFRTREYWLLCWWDAAAGRYVRRHKEIQDHFYALDRSPEGWLVKSNSSLSDQVPVGLDAQSLPQEALLEL